MKGRINIMENTDWESSFFKGILDYFFESPVLLLCIALCYAQGVLILNVIVSLKRKRRADIFKPQLAIPAGGAFSLLSFLLYNFNDFANKSVTLELFKENIIASAIISFALVGVLSIFVYSIKEINYMKDGEKNEQQ